MASLTGLSVTPQERCGRLVCHRILSRTLWERPSAASLAKPSTNSLPATPLWAGAHKSLTSLLAAVRQVQTSMMALAHCPRASARARQIAGWESEKAVYLRPDSYLASKIFNAW